MRLNMIVAVALNNAIGRDGGLIYTIKNDLKRFRELTIGHTIIMGSVTMMSLPKGYLPKRRNIVLSNNPNPINENVEFASSLEEAFDMCRNEEDVFIIGGASVYRQAMPYMKIGDLIHLTQIADVPDDADVFFPEIDSKKFKVQDESLMWITDEETGIGYKFITYKRVKTQSERLEELETKGIIKDKDNPDIKRVDNDRIVNIFISLPFTGMEDTIQERLDTAKRLCENISVFGNFSVNILHQRNVDDIIKFGQSLTDDEYLESMIDDIRLINASDVVLMCSGWEKSKGCRLEYETARTFDKVIYYQNEIGVMLECLTRK